MIHILRILDFPGVNIVSVRSSSNHHDHLLPVYVSPPHFSTQILAANVCNMH